MKTIILILLLTACSAQAQYRYGVYTAAGTTTNATINTNTLETFNTSVDVGASSRADIQLVFRLTSTDTNAMSATCSNLVTATFDSGIDGTYFTNQFTFSVAGQSNAVALGFTNIDVSQMAWLRLVSITNANLGIVTNYSLKIGRKIGL